MGYFVRKSMMRRNSRPEHGAKPEVNHIPTTRLRRSEESSEAVVRILMIQELKAKLASCEEERSALAREVLSSSTPTDRKIDALIDRATLQSESVFLLRRLEELQFQPSRRAQEMPKPLEATGV